MLDELTHDRGEKRPGRAAVPTLEVWVGARTPAGAVPGEHRGVPVEVREAHGISTFSAQVDEARP